MKPARISLSLSVPRLMAWLVLGSVLLHAGIAKAALDCEGTTPIYEIQGKGHISPYVGLEVETCGVVTAVGFNFYFVQDAAGDGDEETADGLFVFNSGDKPAIGEEVRLMGEVAEFIPGGAATGNLSTTQMAFPTVVASAPADILPAPVTLGGSGRIPPAAIVISDDELPVNLQLADDDAANLYDPAEDAIDFYESLEGMLVSITDAVAVSAIRQFGSFSAEAFVLADNGAGSEPMDARSSNGGIRLQPDADNRGDQNPERIQVQFDGTVYQGEQYPYIQVGDQLGSVTGVVGYSFGNFEVLAIDGIEPERSAHMPEVLPVRSADALSVASYNVLNLSAVEDDDAQREKLANHIVMNLQQPDIIALQEIQDNNGDVGDCSGDDTGPCSGVLDASETLQKFVDAIANAGGPQYQFFNVDPLIETTDDNRDDPDAFGGAAFSNIRNAFLYLPDRVRLIDFVGLTREELAARGVAASTAFDASRDPLQATFEFGDNEVTFLNNHFESRFGSTPIFGGPQPFVQAAEDAREAQSLAMHQLVAEYLKDDPNANIVVLGDLNTFEFTNDLNDILRSASGETLLTRLNDQTSVDREYSFIFDGNSQALDHVYVTDALMTGSTLDYVHVNVDYPRRFDDVTGSDHEPLLATFSFDGPSDDPDGGYSLNLRANVYSRTALELFWDRSPNPATRYRVNDSSGVFTTDAISYFVDELQAGTEYTYEVTAIDDNGSVLDSATVSLTTNGDTVPGSTGEIRELRGSVYSSSAIELFWVSEPLSGTGHLTFNVLLNGVVVGSTDGRSFFVDGLDSGTTYTFTVEYVVNSTPVSSELIELTTRGDVASSPSGDSINLNGEVYSSTALELFWSAPEAGANAYEVRRNGEIVTTRDALSFFDSGLQPGTTYEYSVSSVDSMGNVGRSESVVLVTRE